MRRKQVVKLLSIGMAGILTVSSCNMAGSIVYAEETVQEEAVENEVVEEEKSTDSEEESSEGENSSSEQITEDASEEGTEESVEEAVTEENTDEETTEEKEEETTTQEEATEEETTEEETQETLETVLEGEMVALAAEVEDVELKQFYEKELAFDKTSTWDDKGENHLGLSRKEVLHSGAKVSFDLYIPSENAEYEGILKVQGIARLGQGWSWTQNDTIPEFEASDFTQEVAIDGVNYKKVNVSFTFGDEITADYLAEFTVKLAGYQCDYTGSVYYANVKLEDGASQTDQSKENEAAKWDFANNIDGWYYDGVWDNQGENSIEWNEKYQALAMNVDYSKDVASTWSEIKASYWNNDFKAAGTNKLTFDFIYDSAKMKKGCFKIKLFSNSGIDAYKDVNLDSAEDYDGDLKVVHFTLAFDKTNIEKGITIGVIGCETDYQGVIYLDNVTLLAEAEQEAEDMYVDAAEAVTGQKLQLSVQGDTLVTGAGSSALSKEITLVDADAVDSVKQVYAYLQAVGNTDSVIFGQQNNTSHKAGNANLSCSDTMDVVGSYTGIIGLDGLSLTGNEYSADRYLNEMAELDSSYDSVSARIAQASTQEEKNVIAAAALTNYNIKNGAIATLSLHMPNFSKVAKKETQADAPSYTAYNFTGYTPNILTGDVMNQILPGGAYNDAFRAYLDMVADYANQVDGAVLFRPFHENTGSWFWWGAAFCDEQTYKSVYKYTVEYLRDEKNVHNFLYVYGPGSEASSVEEYAARYPGDGYVDMVGFDMYHSNPTEGDSFIANFKNELSIVESFANTHNKLVAVTETGTSNDVAEGDNQTALLKQQNARPDWHQEILDAVKASNASYYLVWANFSEKDGFYTPYVKTVKEDGTKHGHEMMDNFIRFFNQDNSVFAVNQKQALEQMKAVSIHATAAVSQSGYIVSPVAGSRILEETVLKAKVSGVTSEDKIVFVCKGAKTRTLKAQLEDGYASAVLTSQDLKALGEKVGEITLQINGNTQDTVRATFNIQKPQEDPYEIDGFENYYGVDTMLTKSWSTNKAAGSSITLSLSKDYSYEGEYALKFEYTETSDGWAGATVSKEVSWADCDALRFWTVPDGKLQKTVIQITANGNVYEYYMNLNEDYQNAGTTPVLVTIPFEQFVARDIAGNPAGGLANDKGSITSVGLWVNAIADSAAIDENGMVSGTIYYDGITAVASGSSEVVVEKADREPSKPVTPVKPVTPAQPDWQQEADSEQSDNVAADSVQTIAAVVQPSYVTTDGMVVSGWQNVLEAAYQKAQLVSGEVPLAATPDAVSQRLAVDVNITGVTELVIPEKAVAGMKKTGADYNFYYQDIAMTISHETLAEWAGDMDLKVYLLKTEDFGAGFDAFYLKKRKAAAVLDKAVINAVLASDKAGSIAYIFEKIEGNGYELVNAVQISEIGTVILPAGAAEEYVILY